MGRRGRGNRKTDRLIDFGTRMSSGLFLSIVVIINKDTDGG
jgi:hypothetical protein